MFLCLIKMKKHFVRQELIQRYETAAKSGHANSGRYPVCLEIYESIRAAFHYRYLGAYASSGRLRNACHHLGVFELLHPFC